MKLASVQCSLPSKVITNQNILDFICEYSNSLPSQKLDQIISRVRGLLRIAGSKQRYWRETDETPIQLLKNAYHNAMSEADWNNNDIDLLIYVGVGRGFVEPGGAYIVAKTLGMERAECFDILDACMSWSRALEIVSHYFKCGRYKKAAIVNAEFNMTAHAFPTLWDVSNIEQLDYYFPAFTIGEAATVTLLSNEENGPWEFHFASRPDLADLCTIPNHNYKEFSDHPSDKLGKNGPLLFTSYGFEMHKLGGPEVKNVFNRLSIPPEEIDIVFTHASSSTVWDTYGKESRVSEKMYHIYPRTGNVVSASVPTAMALALQENKLKRNDRVVCLVGSAGMSFCAYSFRY